MINVLFLIVYACTSGLLSGTDLFVVLSIHFFINMVMHLRKKLPIDPLFLFYIGVIIVNIANLNLIQQVETNNVTTYKYIVPNYIDTSALIWCISSTCCVMGYQLIKNKALTSIEVRITSRKRLTNLFWILMVLNAFTILGASIISYTSSQFAKVFGLINTIGILFFARLWAKEEDKQYRAYAIALYIAQTYIALVSSFLRFELILPTLYLFSGYFIGKGDIKYIFSYRILPFVAIFLMFSSVFALLQTNRSNFISVFTGEYTTGEGENEHHSGGLLDRSANLAQITNVVNLVEKNGLYSGRASAPIITALIPRAIWPDKPKIQLGAWFALEIGVGSKTAFGTANNSINMTVAGELYLDFGWIGVVLGSLFFGAFLAVLWNTTKFYSSEYNLTGTIFGGYLLILAIGSYADLQVVVTMLSTYLIFLIIKKAVAVL